MTTDIEKQFFETFNIEKRQVDCGQLLRLDCEDCKTCKYSVYEYPEITDSHYLKMICLIAEKLNCFTSYDIDYKNLKEYILKEMILEKDYFDKQQVQSLFKEDI